MENSCSEILQVVGSRPTKQRIIFQSSETGNTYAIRNVKQRAVRCSDAPANPGARAAAGDWQKKSRLDNGKAADRPHQYGDHVRRREVLLPLLQLRARSIPAVHGLLG